MLDLQWENGEIAAILNEAGIGLWRVDMKTALLTLGGRRCIYDLLGINEDFWRINIYDFLSLHSHPDDSLTIRMFNDRLTAEHPVEKVEFRIWNEELRTWIWISVLCRAKFGEDGGAISLSGIVENITLAKRHEKAQQKVALAEERVHIMFDSMPLCCNLWDENFNHIDCNAAAIHLFNVKDKDAYLNNFSKLSPEAQPGGEDSAKLILTHIREAFRTGYKRFEWMHQRLDGEPLPVEITLVRVPWGNSYCVAGYTRDLREHKRILAEMSATCDAMRVARDMALHSTEAKAKFLTAMSHGIRDPVNSIIGMSYLLAKTELTDKQRDYVNKTTSAAQQLLRTIDDILELSEIETAKFEMDKSSFSMDELFSELAEYFRGALRQKKLYLHFKGVGQLPGRVVGDPLRVKQIFLNLIDNAIKFTSQGGVSVCVESVTPLNDELMVKCSVRDTGIGMSGEQVQRIFSVFSQPEGSTTSHHDGTGLGLAICRRLASLMGGNIWCESAVGKGTTFYFTALFGEATGGLPGSAEQFMSDTLILRNQAGKKILLAEDNDINQMITAELLEQAGYHVVVANNGQEAIDSLLDGGDFDLVLMDVQMPVMDGLEASRRIRAYPRFADIPIIAMTARGMADDKELGLSAGMNDHINKPIARDDLHAVLLKWLF